MDVPGMPNVVLGLVGKAKEEKLVINLEQPDFNSLGVTLDSSFETLISGITAGPQDITARGKDNGGNEAAVRGDGYVDELVEVSGSFAELFVGIQSLANGTPPPTNVPSDEDEEEEKKQNN